MKTTTEERLKDQETKGLKDPNQKNSTSQVVQIPIDDIATDPEQPRKEFAQDKLEEMRDSIRANGIVLPLIVRPRRHEKEAKQPFILVAGERRLRGAKLVPLATVPAIVRELDDQQVFAIQMVENLQRENLTALEEAAALQRRVMAGARPDDLARELGLSRATIYGRLALTRLEPPVRKALIEGKISTVVAQLVALVPDKKKQADLLEEVRGTEYSGSLPVRDVQNLIEDEYCKALKEAPFDQKDDKLLPVAFDVASVQDPNDPKVSHSTNVRVKGGACTDCPFRTGNMPEFPDAAKRPNVCTRPQCYHEKTRAHWTAATAGAKEEGQQVLTATEYKRTQGQYVQTSEEAGANGGWHSWQKMVGKHAPETVLAVTDAGLVKLYPRKEAKAAAKLNGFKPYENNSRGYTQEDREKARQKQANEEALRKRRAGLASAQASALAQGLQKLTDKESWQALSIWWEPHGWSDVVKALEKVTKPMAPRVQILANALAATQLVEWTGRWNAKGLKAWKDLGVDLEALEKAEKPKADSESKIEKTKEKTKKGKGKK